MNKNGTRGVRNGRGVINGRSVSEITELRRFVSSVNGQQGRTGLGARSLLDWISQTRAEPASR